MCKSGQGHSSPGGVYQRLPRCSDGEERVWEFAKRELGIEVKCQFWELMVGLGLQRMNVGYRLMV